MHLVVNGLKCLFAATPITMKFAKDKPRRKIRLGTDCSGMEPFCWAIEKIGVAYEHVFACYNSLRAQEFTLANHSPEWLFFDICKRRPQNTPLVDLYAAGFPCQPYSGMGKSGGLHDPRGALFFPNRENHPRNQAGSYHTRECQGLSS